MSVPRKRGIVDPLLLAGVAILVLVVVVYFFFVAPASAQTPEQKAKVYKALEVQLRPIKTKVCANESAIFELTVVNPLNNPKAYMQLTLMVPPGVVVYAGQGVKGGSGLVTTNLVAEPGDAVTLRVQIIALEPGQKVVSGTLYYWFEGESKQDARSINLDFPITVLRCG
ncbi:MAG: hypothetical protein GXO07_01815 [Crenarchaeota archaeon]|nr:hypothetical protein [Thermoproteota archaeon]